MKAGDTLGIYRILDKLGEGGMGEVYRARDSKLGRDVALKVLPAAVAADAERVARFEREAKTLAALNHPHIAAIYGFEESDASSPGSVGQTGIKALVMEFVDGPTLADRITQGAIPVEEALAIAKQIAEALEAAHEQGIIHRDLKPANIKVRPDGTVKVLDFGLAKALTPEGASATAGGLSMSPTITTPAMTQAGMILGTAAYMSPEQARGRPVDKRADIWAFGCVLYEMLTGRRAFEGEDVADTLGNVMKVEPDWSLLPASLSPSVATYLRRALQKNPKQRVGDMQDMRLALEGVFETSVSSEAQATVPAARSRIAWAVAAGTTIVAAVAILAPWHAAVPSDRPLIRLNLDLPEVEGAVPRIALSPDGSRVVYPVTGPDGKPLLATRLLSETDPRILAGTGDAALPFFSPDGEWIGFIANEGLHKVPVRGGAPLTLASAAQILGASWGTDGFITLSVASAGGLFRVPEGGGELVRIGPPMEHLRFSAFPQPLPDNAVLFVKAFGESPGAYVYTPATEPRLLVPGATFARYLPTAGPTGHLVYVDQGAMYAVPFDPRMLEPTGSAVPVLDDVFQGPSTVEIATSMNGSVLYRAGRPIAERQTVNWLDEAGRTQPLLSAPGNYSDPRVSPDGHTLAINKWSGRDVQVLVHDWQNDRTVTIAPPHGENLSGAAWSPDGTHLAMATTQGGGIDWIRADGGGEVVRLVDWPDRIGGPAMSPDGRWLAFHAVSGGNFNVYVVSLDLTDPERPVAGMPQLLAGNPGNDYAPAFSPDGAWIAYHTERERADVWVQPFPGPGRARQVSTEGGVWPIWSRSGLFWNWRGQIHYASYERRNGTISFGVPRLWTETHFQEGPSRRFDVQPDGTRVVIMSAPANEKDETRYVFLLNFFDELRRLAPASR